MIGSVSWNMVIFQELGRFLPSMVGVLVTYAAEDNSVGKKVWSTNSTIYSRHSQIFTYLCYQINTYRVWDLFKSPGSDKKPARNSDV